LELGEGDPEKRRKRLPNNGLAETKREEGPGAADRGSVDSLPKILFRPGIRGAERRRGKESNGDRPEFVSQERWEKDLGRNRIVPRS